MKVTQSRLDLSILTILVLPILFGCGSGSVRTPASSLAWEQDEPIGVELEKARRKYSLSVSSAGQRLLQAFDEGIKELQTTGEFNGLMTKELTLVGKRTEVGVLMREKRSFSNGGVFPRSRYMQIPLGEYYSTVNEPMQAYARLLGVAKKHNSTRLQVDRVRKVELALGLIVEATGKLREGFTPINFLVQEGVVGGVTWSPDSVKVASGAGGSINVLHSMSGRELDVFRFAGGLLAEKGSITHRYPVNSIAWSSDGKRFASSSRDSMKIWSLRNYTPKLFYRFEGIATNSVAWSPDGSMLAFGGGVFNGDYLIRLFEVSNEKELHKLKGHQDRVNGVAWNFDGTKIASCSDDGTVRLWDALSGQEIKKLEGHSAQVNSVCWSPDGTKVASGSVDKTVRVWDALSGKETHVLNEPRFGIESVAWSPDGEKIAGVGYARTLRKSGGVKIWDALTGRAFLFLSRGRSRGPRCVAWSPDSTKLAVGGISDLSIWSIPKVGLLTIGRNNFSPVETKDEKNPKTGSVEANLAKLRSSDKTVKQAAITFFRQVDSSYGVAIPNLATALSDENQVVRAVAAYALGEIGPAAKSAVPKLKELLEDPYPGAQKYAKQALEKIEDEE